MMKLALALLALLCLVAPNLATGFGKFSFGFEGATDALDKSQESADRVALRQLLSSDSDSGSDSDDDDDGGSTTTTIIERGGGGVRRRRGPRRGPRFGRFIVVRPRAFRRRGRGGGGRRTICLEYRKNGTCKRFGRGRGGGRRPRRVVRGRGRPVFFRRRRAPRRRVVDRGPRVIERRVETRSTGGGGGSDSDSGSGSDSDDD